MYVVGLPETVPVTPFAVNIALIVACTVSPELPLYVQVRLNVMSEPAATESDIVRVLLPPLHVIEADPETASEPLSVAAEVP